jgi:polyprenyl-phospho-N-acetylgalactosaminyl synthase
MVSRARPTIAVLLPCFGDGERVGAVLADLADTFGDCAVHVYVVDDGCRPALLLREVPTARNFRVHLLRHELNLGQGAALETARQAAVRDHKGTDAVVLTVDADGQHRAGDAKALVEALNAGADVAVGNRFAGGSEVPSGRRLLLSFARLFERMLTGRAFGDAHNGLRAFSMPVAERLRIDHARMAHATGIMVSLCKMRPALKIVEVPVTIAYTQGTLEKGQRAAGAFTILADLALHSLFGTARGK